MDLIKLAITNKVVEAYPYLGDQMGRFRLGDLVELTGIPASTCHKVLKRMAKYNVVTRQSKRSRLWIKKFDTVSKWMENHFLFEIKEIEKKGKANIKLIRKEKGPL